MKKWLSLGLALVMALGLLTVGGPVAYAAGTLQNVSLSSAGVLSWDAFAGADKYHIKSGALEETTTNTSLDLYDFFAEKCRTSGTWSVELWAESGGTKISEASLLSYTYTSPHPKLDRPTNVNWSDGDVLSWDPVTNATGYTVYILRDGVAKLSFRAFTTSADVSTYLEEGTHKYTAEVYATGAKGYPSSDMGTSNEVTRTTESTLPPLTNVQVSPAGVVSWDAFGGAADYLFVVSNIGFYTDDTSVDARAYLEKNNKSYGIYWGEIYARDGNGERISAKHSFRYSYTDATPIQATVIYLSPEEKTVEQGDSFTVQATLLPEGAEGTIAWKSNNTNIATVNNDGVVTVLPTATVGARTAIVATCNGKTAAMLVTVAEKNIAVEGLFLSPEEKTVKQGDSFTVQTTLLPEGAKGTITWRSNNTNIATVDNKGVVTVLPTATVGAQTAIVATCNGKTAAMLVTVAEKAPTTYTITFNPMSGTVSPTTAVTGTDGKLASFPTPTKEGYTFTGWYAGPKGDTVVPKDTVFTEDTTIYAHWKQAEPTPTDPTVPISPHSGFKDVPDGAYFTEAVAWAVDKAVTQGTGADTFSPNATCTRGQVVTFLWRAAGSPAPAKTDNPFTDVDKSAYYADAVLWAVEKGITNGATADTFAPDQGCTRGQVVTFLHRFEETPAASGAAPFADVADSAYYAKAVAWAVEKNVTQGTGANTFSPDDTCTRGQIVTFLYRDMK